MSRLFDFLQKLNDPTDSSVRSGPNAAVAPEVGQVLSVLQMRKDLGLKSGDQAVGLSQVATEQVTLDISDRVPTLTDPASPAADRFRYLRMRLRTLAGTGKLRSLLVTSPLPKDGKTTMALNLAVSLSERGQRRVLLVDADLHLCSLSRQLGFAGRKGVAECLSNRLNPFTEMRRLEPLGWYFLPAGSTPVQPTELLQAEAVGDLLQSLTPHFDWVVIDSPPALLLTDAVSLSHSVDGTLMVVRAGQTPGKAIDDMIALIGRKRIAGIIVNGVAGIETKYSRYGGYYRKSSEDQGADNEAEPSLRGKD